MPRTSARSGFAWAALVFAAGCSVYDPTLLEQETKGPSVRSGDGGHGVPGDVTDQPREARCGDGIVAAEEKCDTGVAPDTPGACPTECMSLGACVERKLSGTGCQAECTVVPPGCKAGDACCPGTCTAATDADCSSSCGDGNVQPSEGETCEPDSATTPCPSESDCDDSDPCTTDMLTGSAANCNAECTHAPTTMLVAGDDCCPEGANANTDGDCKAECGNGVREPPEECDGGQGCDSSCKLMMTSTQEQCLAMFSPPDACQECACLNCTQLVLDCYASGDATRDMQCVDVIDCSRANGCIGTPCFCGTADTITCTFAPNGACVMEIQVAANAVDSASVFLRQNDPNFAVGRANLLGTCSVMNCPSDCP